MRLLSIVLLLGLFSYLYGQDEKDYYPESGVKSVTVYEQDYDHGKADGGDEIKSVTVFDKKGNIIEEIDYKDGEVHKSFSYEYNDQNQKTKVVEKNEKGKVVEITIYKYQNGLRVERTIYNGDNVLKKKRTYKYEKF